MAYTPDLSAEYLHWSGTETVTLDFFDHDDSLIEQKASVTVKRHSKSKRPQVSSEVTARPGTSFWSIPAHSDVVGSNVPDAQTTITDSGGQAWSVNFVQERRIAGSLVSYYCEAARVRATS